MVLNIFILLSCFCFAACGIAALALALAGSLVGSLTFALMGLWWFSLLVIGSYARVRR